MRNVLLVLFLFLGSGMVIGQIDKENFEKIFDEEVNVAKYNERSSHSGKYLYTKPQTVPAWFLNPPVSSTDEVYAIGISDPEMDTTQAFEMAVYRAQIMANVLRNSTTQLLCDFFINEVENSSNIAYEHFSRINSKIPLQGKYEVIESYRNGYGETLVLIKYKTQKGLKAEQVNKIKLELYKSEIESAAYGNYESIYELWVPSNSVSIPDPMKYQLTELGKRHDVLSISGMQKRQVPIYKLRYEGLTSAGDSSQYSYFSHGLWKEYYMSIMTDIIGKAREKPENIRHLSDVYQSDAYKDKTIEKLTRGISMNKMRFVLTHMSASGDKLQVNLQELQRDN